MFCVRADAIRVELVEGGRRKGGGGMGGMLTAMRGCRKGGRPAPDKPAASGLAALFLSGYGTRITPAYLGNWVAGLLKRCGIDKGGSTHLFRHSFATHLVETGASMHTVQALLGHKNINTTMVYLHLTHRSEQDCRKLVETLCAGLPR